MQHSAHQIKRSTVHTKVQVNSASSSDLCGLQVLHHHHFHTCSCTINIWPMCRLNLSNFFFKSIKWLDNINCNPMGGIAKLHCLASSGRHQVQQRNYSAHRSSFSLPTWSKQIYVLRAVRPSRKVSKCKMRRSAECKVLGAMWSRGSKISTRQNAQLHLVLH